MVQNDWKLHQVIQNDEIEHKFLCNFGVNDAFWLLFMCYFALNFFAHAQVKVTLNRRKKFQAHGENIC